MRGRGARGTGWAPLARHGPRAQWPRCATRVSEPRSGRPDQGARAPGSGGRTPGPRGGRPGHGPGARATVPSTGWTPGVRPWGGRQGHGQQRGGPGLGSRAERRSHSPWRVPEAPSMARAPEPRSTGQTPRPRSTGQTPRPRSTGRRPWSWSTGRGPHRTAGATDHGPVARWPGLRRRATGPVPRASAPPHRPGGAGCARSDGRPVRAPGPASGLLRPAPAAPPLLRTPAGHGS